LTDILLLTAFPSVSDLRTGSLFNSYAGHEMQKALNEAGIAFHSCATASVLPFRPASGISSICCTFNEAKKEARELGMESYTLTACGFGYLRPQYIKHLDALQERLIEEAPNLVVVLGSFPLWALTGRTQIGTFRGTCFMSDGLRRQKCLPTFSPEVIQADWAKRPIMVLDFIKAKQESASPELHVPERSIFIAETLEDIASVEDTFRCLEPSAKVAFDIETAANLWISCISFSADPSSAFVIPLLKYSKKVRASCWPSLEDHIKVWESIRLILETPNPKGGQNILYDLQYLATVGIHPRNVCFDTMLSHHSLYPEMEKGLGFLGSIYTNERAWKDLRPRGRAGAALKAND